MKNAITLVVLLGSAAAASAQCNVAASAKVDCWPGRNANQGGCEARGCCWQEDRSNQGIPWCYRAAGGSGQPSQPSGQCSVATNDKRDCWARSFGTASKQACEARGCCWQEDRSNRGIAWCYFAADDNRQPPPPPPSSHSNVETVNGAFRTVYWTRPEGMRHRVSTRYYDGTDLAGIQLDRINGNYYCWITFKETDESGDDANNRRARVVGVYGLRPRDRIIMRGYQGFAEPYNGLRQDLWNTINGVCRDNGRRQGVKYVFGGFSRGGSLAAIAAAAMYKEGLLNGNEIALVTFGALRALSTADSDEVHNKFEQWRIVYGRDIAPGAIPSFIGVKHYGSNICLNCRGGRDAAPFNGNFHDHDCCYKGWFPVATWETSPGHRSYRN